MTTNHNSHKEIANNELKTTTLNGEMQRSHTLVTETTRFQPTCQEATGRGTEREGRPVFVGGELVLVDFSARAAKDIHSAATFRPSTPRQAQQPLTPRSRSVAASRQLTARAGRYRREAVNDLVYGHAEAASTRSRAMAQALRASYAKPQKPQSRERDDMSYLRPAGSRDQRANFVRFHTHTHGPEYGAP